MQERSGDVFLWHVRVWNKLLACLRRDPALGDRTLQFFDRHRGTRDVDHARKERHRVESGQGLRALLGGLAPSVHGLYDRVAPHLALVPSVFGEHQDPLRWETGEGVEGDTDVAAEDRHGWSWDHGVRHDGPMGCGC